VKKILFFFVIFLFLFSTEVALAASFDTNFGILGKTITSFDGDAIPNKISTQANGKYLVAGYQVNTSNNRDWAIARYDTNGDLDTSFNGNGILSRDFGNHDAIHAVANQANNKIIVGGYSTPGFTWTLSRYNQDGSMDIDFGSGGTITYIQGLIMDFILQPDGKIIAIGYFIGFSGADDVALVRYNSNGTLDTSFGGGDGIVSTPIGGSNDRGGSGVLQPDGKIVVLGSFDAGGHDEIFLARYNENGSLDTSFGIGGKVITHFGGSNGATDLALQPDGKIVITGGAHISGQNSTILARYGPDGSLDDTFDGDGKILHSFSPGSDYANALMIQPDGKIIIAGVNDVGGPSGQDFMLARFDTDGGLDTTFGTNGLFTAPIGSGNDIINDALLLSSGKIIAVGNTHNGSYNDWAIARFVESDNSVNLPVQYYSQNSDPWGPTEYDHANSILGFPTPTTMDRWGCVVTSAAMVLNYHGMTEFSDETAINPGTLNDWLKNNNGYSVANTYSYIFWPAIGTLSEELFGVGKSDVILEHRMFREGIGNHLLSEEEAKDEISNEVPLIFKVKNTQTNGHFAVAKGFDTNTFFLNDPEFNHPDLTSFNDTYYQVDRFTPSNTDLSYIVAVVNPNVEILVSSPSGEQKTGKLITNGETSEFDDINGASYGFSEPISNPDENGNPESLGTGVNEFLLPKPSEDGTYEITLSSDKFTSYTLNIATFQDDGTQEVHTIEGFVGPGADDEFELNFSKDDSSNLNEIVTFDSLIADINLLHKIGDVQGFGIYISLLAKANAAKGINFINSKTAVNILKSLQNELNAQKGKKISDRAYSILSYDIQILISQF